MYLNVAEVGLQTWTDLLNDLRHRGVYHGGDEKTSQGWCLVEAVHHAVLHKVWK